MIPFTLYLVCVVLLGTWVMDDAGISYAYARNFAAGHGLVSQAGRIPVEGFSNFLWVMALAPFFAAGLFDPVWTPKILSGLFVLGAFWLLVRVLRERTGEILPGALAAAALSLAPPIVIWTSSGLENGLLLFLVVALWSLSVLRPRHWAALAGLLAGLIAMTRPDGLALGGAVPAILVLETFGAHGPRRRAVREIAANLGALSAVLAPFLLFRRLYFGLWLPHTYYAKREWASAADRLANLAEHPGATLGKVRDLLVGTAGPVGSWMLVAVGAAGLVLLFQGKLPLHARAAAVLFAFSAMAFVFIENDWMGEYRFATPALAMGLVTAFSVLQASGQAVAHPWGARACRWGAWFLLAVMVVSWLPRFRAFAVRPPTPYADVSRQYVRPLNAMAKALGVEKASTLLADNGATLMESDLTAYDLAGLFEPAVVRTLRKGGPLWLYEHPAFFDWVFEDIRPTFIVTLRFWTNVTAFEQDPRFERDYVALDLFRDAYVAEIYGRDLRSGTFVRKDALRNGWTVERLRGVYEPIRRPRPLLSVLEDVVRKRLGRPRTVDALKAEAGRVRAEHQEPNRAAELLELVLRLAPGDPEALHQLALALDDAGRMAEARVIWNRLADGPRSGPGDLVSAMAKDRLDARIRAAGPPSKEDAPRTGPSEDTSARLLEERARLYRDHRFLEAIAVSRKALAIRPDFAEAYNNICASCAELGRWDEAIEACNQALRIQPDLQIARNNLAWALQGRASEKK